MNASTTNTPKTDAASAIRFLRVLRPAGPWVLTSIVPDGLTTTQSFEATDEAGAIRFIEKQNRAGENLYFTGNSCGRPTVKPTKAAMTGAIMLHADNDPNEGEAIEAAKARIKAAYASHTPPPSLVIDSGNGLQGLWLLDREHVFPAMVSTTPESKEFKAEVKDRGAPVEDRNKALAAATGAPAGTYNVDRLLRLPGTINYPNAAKILKGRSVCQSSVVTLTDARYPLASFPAIDKTRQGPKGKKGKNPAGAAPNGGDEGDDKVAATIRTGSAAHHGDDRSRALFAVLCHWIKLGYCRKTIAQMALAISGDIAAHIAGQAGDPEMTVERQIARAVDRINFALDHKTMQIAKSIKNIRIAFAKMGVTLRYDQFALQEEIEGLKGFGPSVDDAALNRLWVELDQHFGFRPTLALFATVVGDTAQTNRHHPVKDYLAGLKWDGVPRVDTWLINYGGAKDSSYVRAVSALPLLAAVRRIRQPGCKFDEMLVLEGDQGSGRSSAVRTLAVRDDWFLDSVPFNLDPQKVIERLSGKWILEAAELSGLRKTEIEHYKQFLSSPGDSARPAYGRKKLNAPRQCVFIGTTNDEHYLRDDTGNRRNWGVKLAGEFDIDGLKRDRDQLWAEAAHREAAGESIRLDKSLWPAAEKEQDKRTAVDPFDDLLDRALGWLNGQLESASVLVILNIPEAQRNTAMEMRAAKSMKRLGWVKPAQPVWLNGKNRRVWRRGDAPYETITAERSSHTRDLRVDGGRDDRL